MVMLRSLTDKSIKIVFYCDLNSKMSINRLNATIAEAEAFGAIVKAVSCDQCGGNQGLYNNLGVTPEKPYFENPVDKSRKVHAFFDLLHCGKNIRNNLLDHACISNGLHISKKDFEDLLPLVSAEISPG